MDILINHIGYIGVTLLAGMAIGWKTYPLYRAFLSHLRGEDRVKQRIDDK